MAAKYPSVMQDDMAEHGDDVVETTVRRSERHNKGQPPSRFGYADSRGGARGGHAIAQPREQATHTSTPIPENSKANKMEAKGSSLLGASFEQRRSPVRTYSVTSSGASSVKRQKLRLELETKRKMAELAQKQRSLDQEAVDAEAARVKSRIKAAQDLVTDQIAILNLEKNLQEAELDDQLEQNIGDDAGSGSSRRLVRSRRSLDRDIGGCSDDEEVRGTGGAVDKFSAVREEFNFFPGHEGLDKRGKGLEESRGVSIQTMKDISGIDGDLLVLGDEQMRRPALFPPKGDFEARTQLGSLADQLLLDQWEKPSPFYPIPEANKPNQFLVPSVRGTTQPVESKSVQAPGRQPYFDANLEELWNEPLRTRSSDLSGFPQFEMGKKPARDVAGGYELQDRPPVINYTDWNPERGKRTVLQSERSIPSLNPRLQAIPEGRERPPVPVYSNINLQDMAAAFGHIKDIMMMQVQNTGRQNVNESGPETRLLLTRQSTMRDLPMFSGEPEEWAGFKASFDRSTEICKFSTDENFARLQKCLRGQAKEAVIALMVSPENVPEIMLELEERFGKPRLVISRLIDKVRACPSIKDDKMETWIHFKSAVKTLVTSMKSLKYETHMQSPLLIDELVQKLPLLWRVKWGEYSDLKLTSPDLGDFSKWLDKSVGILSNVSLVPKLTEKTDPKSKETTKPSREKAQKKPTETVLTVAEQSTESSPSSNSKPAKVCSYCKKAEHHALKCPVLKQDSVDQRWSTIQTNKLCFGCFSLDHFSKDCQTKKKCTVEGCDRFHNSKLHGKKKIEPVTGSSSSKVKVEESVATLADQSQSKTVLLRVKEVLIKGPQQQMKIFALFDEGASCTLIEKAVAKQLGITGYSDPLQMNMAAGVSYEDLGSHRVNFTIADLPDNETFRINGARTVEDLNLRPQSINVPALRKSWRHLLEKDIPSYEGARPKLILGSDNYQLIAPRELVEGPSNSPVMTRTKLGWLLHGPCSRFKSKVSNEALNYTSLRKENEDLHELMEKFFAIESLGVKILPEKRSAEDERALQILQASTARIAGRFETGLLWTEDDLKLPESRTVAIKRLSSIEKRLHRDPIFAREYCAKMEDFMTKGYARLATKTELASRSLRSWFLPHFGVRNPRKPEKLRLVFDCAAKSNGVSLNDMLLTGPDYLTSLPKNLFKFRSGRTAITGDIKEMYPQIKIIEADQPSQMFLWRGTRSDIEPQTFIMTSMMFGTKSSPSSAQFVKNMNADQHAKAFPRAAKVIKENHYVDNYIDSYDNVEEAAEMIRDVHLVHSKGGFLMCNWSSNSKSALQGLDPKHISNEPKDWSMDMDLPVERILGLKWNPKSDTFNFDTSLYKVKSEILSQVNPPTKKDVAKVVMAIFDPLGLVSHLTVPGKILQQQVWQAKVDWDELIPPELIPNWGEYLGSLAKIASVSIPRCYLAFQVVVVDRQLHLFSDASNSAFATAAYWRLDYGDRIDIVLVMAKSRVKPLKPTTLTIPRLELEGAVLSTRLARCVLDGHEEQCSSVTYWTDSQCVLKWIRSDAAKFQIFVSNRIGQINEASKPEEWRFVPTKLNPADIATRVRSDVDSRFWFQGPQFLYTSPDHWPTEDNSEISVQDLEVKRSESLNYLHEANNYCGRFSSYEKMLKVTAIVLRVLTWRKSQPTTTGLITAAELTNGKLRLELLAQRESFPEYTKSSEPFKGTANRLRQLFPFKDEDGLLRVRGRLGKSKTVRSPTKHPIILDPAHPYTNLLISHLHVKAMHQGPETVLNNLRRNYWVLHGRQAVRKIFTRCQRCKINKSKPLPPIMAALPTFRVTKQTRPFAITGIDYFGPMEVKVRRSREKRWGVLFTCMNVRAVHIELAGSLTADSCIQAIRRFVARRGNPDRIISDNGTNFRGASVELQEALRDLHQNKVAASCVRRNIDWSFIPPHAPHMGGCWERLVGSVKAALKSVLTEIAPAEETLRTLLCEAEAVVNQHQRTHVPVDPADGEALTPNHFLLQHYGANQHRWGPPGEFTDDDLLLRKQWRKGQRLADLFWKRWVHEYLPVLNRQGKWFKTREPIKIGDIVIMVEDNAARNQWCKARVIGVHPGSDGVIRVATVKSAAGGVYKRPVTKLCILDLEPSNGKGDPLPGGGCRCDRMTQQELKWSLLVRGKGCLRLRVL